MQPCASTIESLGGATVTADTKVMAYSCNPYG